MARINTILLLVICCSFVAQGCDENPIPLKNGTTISIDPKCPVSRYSFETSNSIFLEALSNFFTRSSYQVYLSQGFIPNSSSFTWKIHPQSYRILLTLPGEYFITVIREYSNGVPISLTAREIIGAFELTNKIEFTTYVSNNPINLYAKVTGPLTISGSVKEQGETYDVILNNNIYDQVSGDYQIRTNCTNTTALESNVWNITLVSSNDTEIQTVITPSFSAMQEVIQLEPNDVKEGYLFNNMDQLYVMDTIAFRIVKVKVETESVLPTIFATFQPCLAQWPYIALPTYDPNGLVVYVTENGHLFISLERNNEDQDPIHYRITVTTYSGPMPLSDGEGAAVWVSPGYMFPMYYSSSKAFSLHSYAYPSIWMKMDDTMEPYHKLYDMNRIYNLPHLLPIECEDTNMDYTYELELSSGEYRIPFRYTIYEGPYPNSIESGNTISDTISPEGLVVYKINIPSSNVLRVSAIVTNSSAQPIISILNSICNINIMGTFRASKFGSVSVDVLPDGSSDLYIMVSPTGQQMEVQITALTVENNGSSFQLDDEKRWGYASDEQMIYYSVWVDTNDQWFSILFVGESSDVYIQKESLPTRNNYSILHQNNGTLTSINPCDFVMSHLNGDIQGWWYIGVVADNATVARENGYYIRKFVIDSRCPGIPSNSSTSSTSTSTGSSTSLSTSSSSTSSASGSSTSLSTSSSSTSSSKDSNNEIDETPIPKIIYVLLVISFLSIAAVITVYCFKKKICLFRNSVQQQQRYTHLQL